MSSSSLDSTACWGHRQSSALKEQALRATWLSLPELPYTWGWPMGVVQEGTTGGALVLVYCSFSHLLPMVFWGPFFWAIPMLFQKCPSWEFKEWVLYGYVSFQRCSLSTTVVLSQEYYVPKTDWKGGLHSWTRRLNDQAVNRPHGFVFFLLCAALKSSFYWCKNIAFDIDTCSPSLRLAMGPLNSDPLIGSGTS